MRTILKKLKHLFAPIDLTTGEVLRVLLMFFLPVFISLFINQLYSFIESILYGHGLNDFEILGISNANASLYFVANLVSGLGIGLSVISGNAIGENNIEKARKSFVTQLLIVIVATILFTVIFIFTIDPLLNFTGVTKEANELVYESAKTYIFVIYAGMLIEALFYFLLNYLRSIGETVFNLFYVILMIIVAIAANLIMVNACKLGVVGVAVSKYIAEFLAFTAGIIYLFAKRKDLRIRKTDFKLSGKFIFEHIKVSLPLAINFAIIGVGLIFIQRTMNSFGDNAIGAYNYSSKFVDLLCAFYSALGAAVLAFTSQNYGARDYKRIKEGLIVSIYISLVISAIWLVLGIGLSINGTFLRIFLSDAAFNALNVGNFVYYFSTYSIVAFALCPILGLVFVSRNFLTGIKRPLFPFFSGVGETGERILASYTYASLFDFKNPTSNVGFFGFSFGQPLSWVASCSIMFIPIIYYFKSKKLYRELTEEID